VLKFSCFYYVGFFVNKNKTLKKINELSLRFIMLYLFMLYLV